MRIQVFHIVSDWEKNALHSLTENTFPYNNITTFAKNLYAPRHKSYFIFNELFHFYLTFIVITLFVPH